MAALLSFLEQRFGPWPREEGGAPQGGNAPAASGLPPELTTELRAALADVVRGLGLGPHAGFDDVITALRARSGALTETEAALLFLDEWRKQYGKK